MRRQKKFALPKFKIRGDHARVRTLSNIDAIEEMAPARLSFRQKAKSIPRKRLVARFETWPLRGYSDAMTLANLLFPNKFPKLIATKMEKKALGQPITTYSEQVPLSKESQNAITSYYRGAHKEIGKYEQKYYKKIDAEVLKLEDIGIYANHLPMNVGIGKKGFVYFEIMRINVKRLGEFINRLPEKTAKQQLKKKQAIELLKSLRLHQNSPDWVQTHGD